MDQFSSRSVSLFKSLIDAVPRKLNNQLLQDYHRKTHMLYAGNIKRTPVNKKFINLIVDLHDEFVKEMLKRKINHNTPLKKI